ncbi:glycerophosphodiester phosphodiesterase [Novosphingobium fuchskuhlense]|uniref:glycerophosphodiester phosphodiesterase n=1 Tax=Novosphingobium fuchskuhlense TaxID=1117702 RepID=A0A124JTF8_9SPHN|nr:glycerophosphodiester phosphodiesterase family protein [Novosphingobium fuchskuhlense]KUR70145.1 glycerophosphodiester phosphodiesterase [Novosphingobium fuchskuhlense]
MVIRLALPPMLVLGMVMTAVPLAAKPLVFAHRGASAWLPEETLPAYEKAIADGADFIEPDLVPTKDGVLVARHESNITETTDVAAHPEFAARRAVKVIDGQRQEGWFTEDFMLAELKTLRAKERLGALRPESMAHDGAFEVATFEEIVALAARHGKRVGLIPELKHPTYFAGLGFDTPGKLVAAIKASNTLRRAPVIVQCFEVATLKRLHRELAGRRNVALFQLIQSPEVKQPADIIAAGGTLTFDEMVTPRGLAEIATYAQWIGPPLRRVIPLDGAGNAGAPSMLIADAHKTGLKVGVFTFRPENQFLPGNLQNGGPGERWPHGMMADVRTFVAAGVDGFFTDDPALARAALDERG